MKVNVLRGAAFAAVCCSALPLAAQMPEPTINETLVVANRIPQEANRLAASTDLIDREEIAASLDADLGELLETASGVHFTRNGGTGQNASLFMRGTDSDHTLVLIDGQPVNALSDGRARLEFLPLSEIERVEIVRGARSSLYGSEAIGGVISLHSRQPQQGFSGSLGGLTGANSLLGSHLNLAGNINRVELGGGVQWQQSDGIDARTNLNPDRDGFEKRDAWVRLASAVTDTSRLELRFSDNQSETDFDDSSWVIGGPDGSDQYERQQISTRLEQQFYAQLDGQFRLSRSSEHYTSFGLFGPFESNSDRRLASAQLNWQPNKQQRFSLVTEFVQDRYQSNFLASGLDRDNLSLAVIAEVGPQSRPVALSLRQDHNEQYGSHTTGQASIGQNTDAGFFWASYGTAFKAPNFFDLYGYGGDASLQQEESSTGEIGWKLDNPNWQTSASLFRIRTDNLIEFDNSQQQIFNIGNVRIDGLELAASRAMGSLNLGLQLDLLDHKNLDTGQALIRRPERKTRLHLSQSLGQFGWKLSAQHNSDAADFNNQPLPAWTRLDASGSWQPHDSLALKLELSNLLDEQYETVASYNQPGREIRLGIDYRF